MTQKEIQSLAGQTFNGLTQKFWTGFGRRLSDITDDGLMELIHSHVGYETSRSAIQQYRTGVRFSLPFFIPFARYMKIPINKFILDKENAELDDKNVISQHYHLLKDLETGDHIPVPKERFSDTKNLAALWTSERNNESTLPNGQLLIIDTSINQVLSTGVYLAMRGDKFMVLQLKKQMLDTYSVLTQDGSWLPATDLLSMGDLKIVGKALG
ncbi:MAG: hypothetical protein K2W88_00095 [Pararheinheimera sp.]|nr:hypothetical protein [Rheinheimera sp.]